MFFKRTSKTEISEQILEPLRRGVRGSLNQSQLRGAAAPAHPASAALPGSLGQLLALPLESGILGNFPLKMFMGIYKYLLIRSSSSPLCAAQWQE